MWKSPGGVTKTSLSKPVEPILFAVSKAGVQGCERPVLAHSPSPQWLCSSTTHSEHRLRPDQWLFAAPVCISGHLSRLDQESRCFIGPTFSGHLSLSLAADSITVVYGVSVLSCQNFCLVCRACRGSTCFQSRCRSLCVRFAFIPDADMHAQPVLATEPSTPKMCLLMVPVPV